MKHFATVALLLALASTGWARGRASSHSSSSPGKVHVAAHTTKKGVYVPAHDRTAADHTKANNWSTKGNVNPETGKAGTVDPNKK